MAGPTVIDPRGVLDSAGGPAQAFLSPNTRAFGVQGPIATVYDAVLFGDGSVGVWTAPDTRNFACGAPTISQSSTGLVSGGGRPSRVLLVVRGDTRTRSF